MADEVHAESIVTEFDTYEDFLDSQVTQLDLYYLEDEELARQLVELGYRGSGEVIKREEFEARKKAQELKKGQAKQGTHGQIISGGMPVDGVFLHALADREEGNRTGKVSTIIFIRDRNQRAQEISGYIDYAHRLKTEDFEAYFSGRKRLLPRPSDLSFYNWETQTATSNSTSNYQVMSENTCGLLFKNRHDRKLINVDPKAVTPGDNSIRTILDTREGVPPHYLQVVLFDHVTRRKL